MHFIVISIFLFECLFDGKTYDLSFLSVERFI